ncbi:hypothetical protein [Streptomyces sp. NPDC093109]|uniref:hypothetical protein n=1 Tax=Streptomyces sp. NPDC093109 TaxID=3154977 RepID=UPI00344C3F5F
MAAVACGAAVAIGGGAVLVLDGQLPGGSGSASVLGDEPYYGTTAELEDSADLIVRVKLGAGHEETHDGMTDTVARAEVLATAKGESPGDAINVAYTAPGSGPETAGLRAGTEYVLLLSDGEDGRYYLVNTTQGWYEVDGDGRMAGRGRGPVGGEESVVGLSAGVRKALGLGLVGWNGAVGAAASALVTYDRSRMTPLDHWRHP